MNLYEHTIIARQDVSPNDLKKIQEKYLQIVEQLKGKIVKSENWGLLNLAYLIKKNKKGNYIHFKIEGNGKLISELEKNEKIDKNLLRFVTIKVKKFDLKTEYFNKDKYKEDKYKKDKAN
jgi:small subunit ribosomal protein S6|tara:strand:+ start:624 stop:983 length:360 start_codon:yes stop_codon:yes gene_type:complete